MQEVERSAASVEEAIEAALRELGVSEQEAQVEVIQEAKSGFFGIASQPAVVRVRSLVRQAPPAAEELDDQAEVVATFVEGLMDAMGLEAEVEIADEDGLTYVDVFGATSADEMGILIGKRGHTLDAIQELVRGHVYREVNERCGVLVDVEDYRKRRRAQIVSRAREVATRVKKSGRPEKLPPMTALERKIVHDTVAEMGGLETSSEGEEPDRRVVITRPR